MLRVLDHNSDAGRPDSKSQTAQEADLVEIRGLQKRASLDPHKVVSDALSYRVHAPETDFSG